MKYMRVESLVWLLTNIREDVDTIYQLERIKSSAYTYIRYAKKYGLIKQYKSGRKKPFRLTKKGEVFLDIFSE